MNGNEPDSYRLNQTLESQPSRLQVFDPKVEPVVNVNLRNYSKSPQAAIPDFLINKLVTSTVAADTDNEDGFNTYKIISMVIPFVCVALLAGVFCLVRKLCQKYRCCNESRLLKCSMWCEHCMSTPYAYQSPGDAKAKSSDMHYSASHSSVQRQPGNARPVVYQPSHRRDMQPSIRRQSQFSNRRDVNPSNRRDVPASVRPEAVRSSGKEVQSSMSRDISPLCRKDVQSLKRQEVPC